MQSFPHELNCIALLKLRLAGIQNTGAQARFLRWEGIGERYGISKMDKLARHIGRLLGTGILRSEPF